MAKFEFSERDPRPYVQMAVMLRRRISEGELRSSDPTPSIGALSRQYGHARPTCGKALQLLMDEGLLIRVPGFGYYVA